MTFPVRSDVDKAGSLHISDRPVSARSHARSRSHARFGVEFGWEYLRIRSANTDDRSLFRGPPTGALNCSFAEPEIT
jgi:hypothetical protein